MSILFLSAMLTTVRSSLSDYKNNVWDIYHAMLFQQTVTVSYVLMLTWTADMNTDVTEKEWNHICEKHYEGIKRHQN